MDVFWLSSKANYASEKANPNDHCFMSQMLLSGYNLFGIAWIFEPAIP